MSRSRRIAIPVVGIALALACGSKDDPHESRDRDVIEDVVEEQQTGKGTGEAMSGPATRRGIETPGSGSGVSLGGGAGVTAASAGGTAGGGQGGAGPAAAGTAGGGTGGGGTGGAKR